MRSSIVLDQFPRNMFRGDATQPTTPTRWPAPSPTAPSRAASTNGCRVASANSSICRSCTRRNSATRSAASTLARAYGDDVFTKYAEQHAAIVRRFGRFPHRNAMLGRATSPEEQAFLDEGGFAG